MRKPTQFYSVVFVRLYDSHVRAWEFDMWMRSKLTGDRK
jgi:hypothetical protein